MYEIVTTTEISRYLQIVIQIGEELREGCVLIRTAENKQGHCSVQYLQEV